MLQKCYKMETGFHMIDYEICPYYPQKCRKWQRLNGYEDISLNRNCKPLAVVHENNLEVES